MNQVIKFLKAEDGQDLIEYALLAALIALAAVVAMQATGTSINGVFNSISSQLSSASARAPNRRTHRRARCAGDPARRPPAPPPAVWRAAEPAWRAARPSPRRVLTLFPAAWRGRSMSVNPDRSTSRMWASLNVRADTTPESMSRSRHSSKGPRRGSSSAYCGSAIAVPHSPRVAGGDDASPASKVTALVPRRHRKRGSAALVDGLTIYG